MGKLAKSPWLLHYDASSCNGCDIEVLACTMPSYDIERFGIINTGDPFQADILLITGGVNSQSEKVVKQIYSQMPNPKVVVAVGICACTGGVFKDCYNIKGGVDTVIPVDIYVPGCAARPESIIDGVVKALALLKEKQEAYRQEKRRSDMETLRLVTATDEKVSSITQIYPCAFMQENEVAELFGVPIENITQDYRDKLYRIDRGAPFKEKG